MDARIKNIIGNRYGKLLVISYDEKKSKEKGRPFWVCQCDCGNIKSIRGSNLQQGGTVTCRNCPRTDYSNMKFGRWTLLKPSKKEGKFTWICRCDCGTVREVYEDTILSGASKSCGCYKKELLSCRETTHSMTHTRIYNIYHNMLQRCYNSNNNRYKDYGGRGITICESWMCENGFMNFYQWAINNGYKENLTIDRINRDGNYEPANCRWVTKKEQDCNKRNNIFFEFCGIKKCLKEWVTLMNWNYSKYSARAYRKTTVFNEEEINQIKNKIKEIYNE